MASGFSSLATLTKWVRAILIANIVVSLLAFPAGLALDYVLYETEIPFELIDIVTLAIGGIRFVLFLAAVIAVSLWIWRGWSNLVALGVPGLRFSPAYAVGAFFIPVLNLLEPFRAMRELANRSAGEDAYQADTDVGDATAWWGCTIAAAAVNLFLWYKEWFNTNQMVMIVGHWATEMAMDFMSDVLIAGSAFFLFRLVGKIAHDQQALADGGWASVEVSLQDGIRVLETRAQVAIWSIWAFCALSVAASLADIAEASGMIDVETAAVETALLLMAVYFGDLVVYIASVVLIAMWIHRGHANLVVADLDRLQYSPGWAIGWFFIPIANLFKPFGAMRELWNASLGARDDYGAGSPASLKLWWGCFLAGNILGNISFRLTLQGDPEMQGLAGWLSAASNGVLIVCALVLAKIIADITAAQGNHLQAAVVSA